MAAAAMAAAGGGCGGGYGNGCGCSSLAVAALAVAMAADVVAAVGCPLVAATRHGAGPIFRGSITDQVQIKDFGNIAHCRL